MKVFNTDFNMSFGMPCTDTCSKSWNKVKLFKRGVSPERLQAKHKYKDRLVIKAVKYKDNLIQQGLLSKHTSDFYKALPCEVDVNSEQNDSEYEDDYVD